MERLPPLVAALIFALTACTVDQPGREMPRGAWVLEVSQVICEHAVSCGAAAACRPPDAPTSVAVVDKKDVVFISDEKVAECTDAVASVSCEQPFQQPAACDCAP